MDTFFVFQFVRRLIVASVFVFAAGMLFVSWPAAAQSSGSTTPDGDTANATAWANCNRLRSGDGGGPCAWYAPGSNPSCLASSTYGCVCFTNDPYSPGEYLCWQDVGPYEPAGPCSSLSNSTSWVQGKVLDGYYTSVRDSQGNMCRVNLQPVTPPMTCGDGWCTLVEYNPVTNGADTSPVSPAGSVDNSNGQPAQPDVPDYPASGSSAPSNPPPTICGGGSCYDPSTGNACAVGASGQVCINVANGSGATQGGCSSSGSTTICGGSPTSPSPVGSSGSTITDPPSQIQGSDSYTNANPSTGQTGSTTVNVYSSGGDTSNGSTSTSMSTGKGSTSTKNGQSGPASSSSTGNGDSFNGGTDCNTPPVCQGDAVMCGVAQEAWRTKCSVDTQTVAFAGSDSTKQPPTFASDSTKYGKADVWQQSSGTGNTVGDAANQGSYDQSGFGYSTSCPMTDLSVSVAGASFVVPFSEGCVIGPWIYWTVIGFSLYRAARITAGSAV